MRSEAPMLAAYNALLALLPTCPPHLEAQTSAALVGLAEELWPRCPLDCECSDCHWYDGCAGRYDFSSPLRVHGVSGAHAIVTRSITRGRTRFGATGAIPWMKRAARRKHRRAWRVWARDTERREPVLRSLTSYEVW